MSKQCRRCEISPPVHDGLCARCLRRRRLPALWVTFGLSAFVAAIGLVYASSDWGNYWPVLAFGLAGMLVALGAALRDLVEDMTPGSPAERTPGGEQPEGPER